MNWTTKHEQQYRKLQADLHNMEQERLRARSALDEVLAKLWDRDAGWISTDAAIQHADQLRDALAPFDSGIRSAPESA